MSNRKVFKLSLIAAACMAVSVPVFSGVIVSGPQGAPSGDSQGFGGFNLDNVEVNIINVLDGTPTGKVFNELDGSYDPMTYGETFVSPISDGAGSVTGNLHGKDWPVGEPSGIKVITTAGIDEPLSHNRPGSCILSTSYFEYSELPDTDPDSTLPGGWLDSQLVHGTAPNPTLCGSPFQTHKRFKIDAVTPTADATVADPAALAEPIDVVINVDPASGETATRRYMILQKLNNYSDRRYSGYTVEVGFGVGASFVNATTAAVAPANLSLSIGTGEDTSTDPVSDIWDAIDLATFSAGLFGTADDKHPNDGFFDTRRAGYYVGLDANATTISSAAAFDSNYTSIFGNWLPSKWEPAAIFYDDDQNPLTDASLVAFWGDNPNTVEEDYTWLQGNATGFAPATLEQLYYWSNDTGMPDGSSQYEMGSIEDVLNLGMTYIVNLGDVTTFPASVTNFTIRMTPIVDVTDDGTVPGWIANPAIAPADLLPVDYVPPVDVTPVDDTTDTTTTTSSGGSAAVMDNAGMIVAILAFLGLGGWLVRRKLAK